MNSIFSHRDQRRVSLPITYLNFDKMLVIASTLIPLICLLLFFGYPLYIVLIRSLTTPDGTVGLANYVQVFNNPTLIAATLNSLLLSFMTMLIALLLGFAIAYRLERTSTRGELSLRWHLPCHYWPLR